MESASRDQAIELDLLEIAHVMKKSVKMIFILCIITVFLTGIFTYFFIPKQYVSNVVFYIEEQSNSSTLSMLSGQLGGALGGLAPSLGQSTNADLCSEIIFARQFLHGVLKKKNLDKDSKNFSKLRKSINVTNKKSSAIEISVIWTNPQEAYQLAEQIFADYKKYVDEQVNQNNHSHRRFIEEQYNISLSRLNNAEVKLLDFQKTHGILNLPDQISLAQENYADIEKQKIMTEIGLNEARQRLTASDNLLINETPQNRDKIIESIDPIMNSYKVKLVENELALAEAREKYTEQNPEVKSLLFTQEELIKQMEAEKENILAGKFIPLNPDLLSTYLGDRIQVAGFEARQEALELYSKKMNSLLIGLPDELLSYERLMREQKVAEQVYVLLTTQLEQARITEAKDEDNVEIHIIDPPVIPGNKYGPSTVMNMVIAGGISLFLGLALALFKEYWITGFPFMGEHLKKH